MLKRLITTIITLTTLVSSPLAQNLESQPNNQSPWHLPQELNSTNTDITFQVDTTWHMLHGNIKESKGYELSGKAWLAEASDPSSIRAEIIIPVVSLNTDNESRDKKMRSSMQSDLHSNVILRLQQVKNLCPEHSVREQSCSVELLSTLSIAGTIREIVIPAEISFNNGYIIRGQTSFSWKAFGVKDPSILVARVKDQVTVNFEVKL